MDVNPEFRNYTTPQRTTDLADVDVADGAAEPYVLVRRNGAFENLAPAAAVASPTSDTVGTKAAIDAIIAALQAAGIVS